MGGTIYDLYDLELAYQPYYSTTEDINNVLGSQAINIFEGRVPHVKLSEFADVRDEYMIIDIRNEGAFDECHIKDAILMEGKSLRTNCAGLPRDKKILLYDDTGRTVPNQIKMLNNFGFDNIYMLDGGMLYLRGMSHYLGLDLVVEG